MPLLLRAAYRLVYRARRICIHLACCALGAGAPHAAVSLDRAAKFLDELRTREHSDEPTWAYHGGLPAAGSCATDSPALKGFDFSRKEEARQRRPRAQCLLSMCALSSVLHLVFHLGHGLFYAAMSCRLLLPPASHRRLSKEVGGCPPCCGRQRAAEIGCDPCSVVA